MIAVLCYLSLSYQGPTNVELVATTPRIVIAKALAEKSGAIDFEITDVLHGSDKVGAHLAIAGNTQYEGVGDKLDLFNARLGAYIRHDECIAVDYKLGARFLLMLDGNGKVRDLAYTRVNEEVDTGDPWIDVVKTYLKATTTADLEALIARGEAKGASALDKAIAKDVHRHFDTPTQYKPLDDLVKMYDSRQGQDNGAVLVAIAGKADAESKPLMKKIVVATIEHAMWSTEAFDAIAAYYKQVDDPDVDDYLARRFFKVSDEDDHDWIVGFIATYGAGTDPALVDKILPATSTREANELASWFVRHPSKTGTALLKKRIGTHYAALDDATLALAALGDADVIAWAAKVVAKAPPGQDVDRYFERVTAVYAIARSPLTDADALAQKLIANGGDDRVTLREAYRDASENPNVKQRLTDIDAANRQAH